MEALRSQQTTPASPFRRVQRPFRLGPVVVDRLASDDEHQDAITACLDDGRKYHLAICRVPDVKRARHDAGFRDVMRRCEVVMATGWGMGCLSMLHGARVSPLTDAMHLANLALDAAADTGMRVLFLGGRSDDDVFESARAATRERPDLRVAGALPMPSDLDAAGSARRLVAKVNETEPDVIICRPDTPSAESFGHAWRSELDFRLFVSLWGGWGTSFQERFVQPIALAPAFLALAAGALNRH